LSKELAKARFGHNEKQVGNPQFKLQAYKEGQKTLPRVKKNKYAKVLSLDNKERRALVVQTKQGKMARVKYDEEDEYKKEEWLPYSRLIEFEGKDVPEASDDEEEEDEEEEEED
jgi:hypothetical protein